MPVEIKVREVAQILTAPAFADLPSSLRRRLKDGRAASMSQAGRPGTGGRNVKVVKGVQTAATAELHEWLGPPSIVRGPRGLVEWWEVDPKGSGVICGRLSTRDQKEGETSAAQIHGAREMCEREGLKPRFVLMATEMTGVAPLEQRSDLMFISELIEGGKISWVMYREVDRITRDPGVGWNLWRMFEETGVDLYLTTMGRKLDWESDGLLLATLGGMSYHERRVTRRRTFSAIERRHLLTGRGWPGCQKFGFRKTLDGFLEVDPEQWPIVETIHYDYARVSEGAGGSIRKLKRHLDGLSFPMTRGSIHRVLRDPIYVTGEWGSNVMGTYYPGRTIEIASPIPAEVQERNIQLLENSQAGYSITPLGTYLLNNVPVFHSRCLNERPTSKAYPDGRIPRLKGRNYPGRRETRPPVYGHVSPVPKCCPRYSIPAEKLERVVIEALVGLATSTELQAAYLSASNTDSSTPTKTENVESLKRKVDALKRSRAELMRRFVDAAAQEDLSMSDQAETMIGAIEFEIESCELRLQVAQEAESTPRKKLDNLADSLRATLDPGPDATNDQLQRRAALIGALLSKVVVHDSDQGPDIELFGHLIPKGRQVFPLELQSHIEGSLDGSHKPSAKRTLTGHDVTFALEFGEPQASWRSPRIPLGALSTEEVSLKSIRELLKWVNEHVEPGLLFSREPRSSAYDRMRRERGWNTPSVSRIAAVLGEHSISVPEIIRQALGSEEALRKGRVYPGSSIEAQVIIRWALEEGFTLDSGWYFRWAELARSRPYVPGIDVMNQCFGESPQTFAEAAYEISREMGIPFFRTDRGAKVCGGAEEKSSREFALENCVTGRELISHKGVHWAKLANWRRDGKAIGFRIHGGRTIYYPNWQFDIGANPLPVVESIAQMVDEYSWSLWDLQKEMLGLTRFKGELRTVATLALVPAEAEWLIVYLRSRPR